MSSFSDEWGLTWNTFPHTDHHIFSPVYCETERHAKLAVPATTFQMIWRKNPRNLAQSNVVRAWFTCTECSIKMGEAWETLTRAQSKL